MPLVPAGGLTVIWNVLLAPEALVPRLVGLNVSHTGPDHSRLEAATADHPSTVLALIPPFFVYDASL